MMCDNGQPANNPFGRHHGVHEDQKRKYNHSKHRRQKNYEDRGWEGEWCGEEED